MVSKSPIVEIVSGTVGAELACEWAGIVSDTDDAPSWNEGTVILFRGDGGVTIGGWYTGWGNVCVVGGGCSIITANEEDSSVSDRGSELREDR